MKKILSNILRNKRRNNVVTIVSGLPRSGTSMMMRMLEAGGLAIMSDNIRKPDEDNPRGYYEFEKVKKIRDDVSWLDNCRGTAFKMVSELLYHLPRDKKYKVIFMRRNMEEIIASQNRMLGRLDEKGANVSDEKMAELYEKHLQNVEEWLTKQDNIQLINVNYNEVINHPFENARIVNEFLGGKLNREKMLTVVEKSLYRQRR